MARTSRSAFVDKMEEGDFWIEETPVGTLDGSNKTFTLSVAPNPVASAELQINSNIVAYTTDFTISGDTLTMVEAWPAGTVLYIRFRAEPA